MRNIAARLPHGRDVLLAFAWCFVVLGSWSTVAFLQNLRGWAFYLPTWDIIGLFAYPMVFSFVEAVVVCAVIVGVAAVMPFEWIRRDFPAHAAAVVLVSGLWAYWGQVAEDFPAWPSRSAAMILACYAASLVLGVVLLWRFPALAGHVRAIVDRFSVLLVAYIPLLVFSGIVIVLRNLG
jgi:hypothetical protein